MIVVQMEVPRMTIKIGEWWRNIQPRIGLSIYKEQCTMFEADELFHNPSEI